MKFLFPGFLWALFAVLVPIIIHLVNLRRHQTVYFSNVNFLKKVKKETRRKSRLKQLLILLSRVMMLAALVLAFSKPYIPGSESEKQQSNKAVCIYIDNSFSMSAEGPEGIALESARQKAFSIVNAGMPDTKYALLTNNLGQKHFRFYTRQEMTQLIGEVELSHITTPLSTIVLRMNDLLNNFLFSTDQVLYLISDFQKTTSDLMNLKPDTATTYNFTPVKVNKVPNLYIDSCWFDSPAHHVSGLEVLNVTVVNDSENEYTRLPVNFYLNDSLKALATTDIGAGEKETVQLQFTNTSSGLQRGKVEISDYPVVYDNQLFLSYRVDSKINTLLIHNGGGKVKRNIEAVFANDGFIAMDMVRPNRLQISKLPNYSALVVLELQKLSTGLCDELTKYVETGGTLIFIPSLYADTASYNLLFEKLNVPAFVASDTVKIPVKNVAFEDVVYKGVFKKEAENVVLPNIKYRYRFGNDGNLSQNALLGFADNTTAIGFSGLGKGKVYTFSFPLSEAENEFTGHLLFVPTLYNMVLYSTPFQELFYVLGRDRYFEVKSLDDEVIQNPVIRNLQNGTEIIPSVIKQGGTGLRLRIDPDFDAGIYEVLNASKKIDEVALNYDLNESDLNYYTPDELITYARQQGIKHLNLIEQKAQSFEGTIRELDQGKKLWTLFIAIALFFLLLEAGIIKFWDVLF